MSETIKEFVTQMTSEQLFAVWFLIGAALVFWMQAGFAMVEAGFTRAKNTGNIIMKNLMDFCIGTVTFILIGFGLLMGEDLIGLLGKPGFDIFTSYADFDFSSFVFNLVFCATTATHVLGCGAQKGKPEYYRGVQIEANLLPKVQVDIVVCTVPVGRVIEAAKKTLYTGHIGDGKIFVCDVEEVVKVRTGQTGVEAMENFDSI